MEGVKCKYFGTGICESGERNAPSIGNQHVDYWSMLEGLKFKDLPDDEVEGWTRALGLMKAGEIMHEEYGNKYPRKACTPDFIAEAAVSMPAGYTSPYIAEAAKSN